MNYNIIYVIVVLLLICSYATLPVNAGNICALKGGSVGYLDMTYDLPVEDFLVNVRLRVLKSVWSPDQPIAMEYFIRVKGSNKPLEEFLVILKVNIKISDFTGSAGTYLLAKVSDYRSYEGIINIFVPSQAVNLILKADVADILPILIVVTKNSSYHFRLTPYRLIINAQEIKEIIVGNCSASFNISSPSELCICVTHPVTRNLSESNVRITSFIKYLSNEEFKGILTILANDVIISSKSVTVGKFLKTEISIPLQSLIPFSESGKVRLKAVLTTIGMDKITDTALTITLKINIRKPIVTFGNVPSLAFEGDQLILTIQVYNPNSLPLHVIKAMLIDGGVSVLYKDTPKIIMPNTNVECKISLRFNRSGIYKFRFILSYSIGEYKDVLNITLPLIKVTKVLSIKLMNKLSSNEKQVPIEVIAFRPINDVLIVAERGNETYQLLYVGSFLMPGSKIVNLSIQSLKPGNYSLYALSLTEDVKSNIINISIQPTQNSKIKNNTNTTKVGKTTEISIGLIKSIKVKGTKIYPGSNVSVELILTADKNIEGDNVRLYKLVNGFSPPWVLQPLTSIRKVDKGIYELTFKAPSSEGSYTYKVQIVKEGKVLDSREFSIQVEVKNVATTPLLPPEVFYPLIITSALGSLILFRRYSKKR